MTPGTDDHCTISIARISTEFTLWGDKAALRDYIEQRYGEFLGPAAAHPFRVEVRLEEGPQFIPFGLPGEYEIRIAFRDGKVELESYFEKGWMDLRKREGQLTMRRRGEMENFLRVLYAWRCLEHDALLLHASGIIRNGRGYAFLGHSGSGKTTVSSLADGGTVLSDDMVIVGLEADTAVLYGVPFRGELQDAPRANASAPLCRLSLLTKDGEHRVEPIRAGEELARMAECAPFVMSQPAAAAHVLSLCAQIENRVPLRVLHFKRDAGFWSVLDGCE